MNEQTTRKLVVAGGMAVVIAIAATIFAMRPPAVAHVAEAVAAPPPVADSAVASEAVAPIPDVPATAAPATTAVPAAPVVAAPATSAHKDVVASKRVTAGKSNGDAIRSSGAAPGPVMPAAVAEVARSSERVAAPAEASEARPETSSLPVAVASDSEITANVKSEIAVDSPGKNEAIGVITTNGAVALTGSLASQTDIDHIRLVVARVKDVKSVNTTALSISVL
jgi:osmotically-inducible protein OsmY